MRAATGVLITAVEPDIQPIKRVRARSGHLRLGQSEVEFGQEMEDCSGRAPGVHQHRSSPSELSAAAGKLNGSKP